MATEGEDLVGTAALAGLEAHHEELKSMRMEFFAPVRAFYARSGFVPCPPFGDYAEDPLSTFMTLGLSARR